MNEDFDILKDKISDERKDLVLKRVKKMNKYKTYSIDEHPSFQAGVQQERERILNNLYNIMGLCSNSVDILNKIEIYLNKLRLEKQNE